MEVLKKFLQAEINSKDQVDAILSFVDSYEVRKGEYEGNEFIILKIDRENFILYPEYDDGDDGIQIPFSTSVYKNQLKDEILEYAKEKKIV
ncbi:MAG: hypothetical protein E7309_16025 [Butyrivibrio sp.]|nr:hypothetical protein [Butyrivibrio sp.]